MPFETAVLSIPILIRWLAKTLPSVPIALTWILIGVSVVVEIKACPSVSTVKKLKSILSLGALKLMRILLTLPFAKA